MKVRITLGNGTTHDLLGVDDAADWVRSFGVRGTSKLGDWMEVLPEDGDGRTFVRASDVVAVHIVPEEHDEQASDEP